MALLWLRIAVLLYGIAALAVLPAALYNRPRWRHLAMPAALSAVFFHFVSLAEMLNAAHHRLPVDTHETQTLLGLLLALAFLVVYWRYKTVSLGIVLLPICFLLGLVPAFHPGEESTAFPMIHTGWIFLHVALLLEVDHDHVGALLGEAHRVGSALSVSGTGDERGLALQPL